MGESRVLVGVSEAEGRDSGRSMVCHGLHGGWPLREGKSQPLRSLLELGAGAEDGSVRYVTCFSDALAALPGPLPPQALSPGRGIRLRLSGRDLMVERVGMRGSPTMDG